MNKPIRLYILALILSLTSVVSCRAHVPSAVMSDLCNGAVFMKLDTTYQGFLQKLNKDMHSCLESNFFIIVPTADSKKLGISDTEASESAHVGAEVLRCCCISVSNSGRRIS